MIVRGSRQFSCGASKLSRIVEVDSFRRRRIHGIVNIQPQFPQFRNLIPDVGQQVIQQGLRILFGIHAELFA